MPRIPLVAAFTSSGTAREQQLVHRPLYDGAPAELPVLVLTEEGEPVTEDRLDSLGIEADDAFTDAADARAEAADASWTAQAIPVKGGGALPILVREGDTADVEDVIVPQVLEQAAGLLRTSSLAIALPARGILLATDASQKWQLVAAFATAARLQYERAGEDALWPGVLRVESGHVKGVIELSTVSLDAAAARARERS